MGSRDPPDTDPTNLKCVRGNLVHKFTWKLGQYWGFTIYLRKYIWWGKLIDKLKNKNKT